jgi:1-acyl-sn-glycerol-3-phosphate acyltransferase
MIKGAIRFFINAILLLCLILSWSLLPFVGLFSRRISTWLKLRQMSLWARATLFVLGVQVVSVGPKPKPPFLLASNHLSYLDILVLWSQIDSFFLGKAELARWPFMGLLIRAAGTLFIDRTKKSGVVSAIEKISQKVMSGFGVIFFPEGTSSSGGTIRRFRPNIFEVAVLAKIPVHVAVLRYETTSREHSAEYAMAWWGNMTFAAHFLRLHTFDKKIAYITFVEESVPFSNRKNMALKAERIVSKYFIPLHNFEKIKKEDDCSVI